MIINNNLTSLSALNISRLTDDMLQKSYQPLATGLRVNSAADDASGLAISENMRAQIKGYDTALRNAQDGISMLRTAEGSLGDANDMLHRIRELSIHASNDSLTHQDRKHLQEEVDELKEQINRISDYTHYNKKKLLDGTSGALWSTDDEGIKVRVKGGLLNSDGINTEANYRIEVKASPGKAQVQESNIMTASDTMIFTAENYDDDALEVFYDKALHEISQFYTSEGAFIVAEPQSLAIIQGDGKITGIMLYGEDTLHDVSSKINNAIAYDLGQEKYTDDANHFSTLSGISSTAIYDDDGNITGHEIHSSIIIRSAVVGKSGELYFSGDEDLINALGLNTVQKSQEGTYSISIYDSHSGEALTQNFKITGNLLQGIIHENVDVEFDSMAGIMASWDKESQQYILQDNGGYSANIHLANNGMTFQVGANQNESFSVQFGNVSAESLGIDRVNVMTRELAGRSTGMIDDAIDSVVKQRTQIVSYSNALEHTIGNITTSGENLTQSRSRIVDADYAQSAMRYIEFQILSKAETAILAQANQQPEAVFSLINS